jgi:RNA polymerase sigma-70 factor (ECF subfamily)
MMVARRGASPERELAIKQLGDQICNALRSIPTEQRRAFLLREVQGLSYEQISDLEGVPVGTVRSRLNRARSGLRDQLRGCRELPFAARH